MLRLVLLGPPAVGKGTQAIMIAEKYSIPHISTGDILRSRIKEQSPLGIKAKEFMDKGALVPDDLVIEMVIERLEEKDCQSGFLMDGFPRTVFQAQELDVYLKKKKCPISAVINLEADEKTLVDRMAGRRVCRNCGATYHIDNMPPKVPGVCDICGGEVYQRSDDTRETVQKRFLVYNEQTAPLVDYYKEEGLLKTFDASVDKKLLFQSIVAFLGETNDHH